VATNGKSGERSLVPEERRRRILERLRKEGGVSVSALEQELGVSSMTIRRDLEVLEQQGKARRTHGGAILPELAGHEDSFQQRVETNVEQKKRLGEAAAAKISAGESVFLDASSTSYYAARSILDAGKKVTVIASLVPIMDLLSSQPLSGVDLIGLGGSLRKLTRSFVGPQTTRAISAYFTDKVFLSVRGVTQDGHLTDPDPLEAEVKRAMIAHAREAILLVDGSKFGAQALCVVAHVSNLSLVITTSDAPEEAIRSITQMGVPVEIV